MPTPARWSRLAVALVAVATPALAQQQPPPPPLVAIDLPDDGVELTLLVDLVTRRLHVPIVYDAEQLRGKKVIVRVPTKVPESALMGILQSALRLKGLALVDAEQAGFKQVVTAANLAAVATPASGANPADGPIAQAFLLDHADPAKLVELVRPFLTTPGGYVQAEVGQKVLLVSDYPSVVRRVAALVRELDTASPAVETRFVPMRNADAPAVATAVTALVASRDTFQWGSATASGVTLTADERSNQVVVVAPPARMADVIALIDGLDHAPELQTRVYRLKTVTPDRVDQLVRSLLDPGLLKRGYQAGPDRDSQALAVAATPAVHERIAELLRELDVPAPQSSNPVQFYKLKNTKAADLLGTINGLIGDTAAATPAAAATVAPASNMSAGSNATATAGLFGRSANATNGQSVGPGGASNLTNVSPVLGTPTDARSSAAQSSPGVLAVRSKDATVAADVNTNSVIVVGPPAVQARYADLIRRLDQRRPQVQIECTIVTLDTTDNTTFGVDIGRLGGSGTSQLLSLSSFGISSANPITGVLTPVGGTGGTFALLSPRIADVVIRALQQNNRARLVSAPQLLVNDNGVGKLESVAQEPYAVLLDASSTQSVTSLGGLASAGTSISVEPHISQADYLQLGYTIELSSFTGAAQNGLPPPSQKNSVDSEVTIPDGYTIVVGGLTTHNFTTAVNTIPILGDIPFLRFLFGTRSRNVENSTLFVFIRPVILRDDQFDDLKYISGRALKQAGLDDDFPKSEPIPMR